MTVTPSITSDFSLYVDNLTTLTLAVRGGSTYTVLFAHKNQIGLKEHVPSGGDVKQGDVIWQFSVDCTYTSGGSSSGLALESLTEIPLGSTLTEANGTVWTILTATLQVWTSKWECACRNLTVVASLDTVVTVQVANYTKDDVTGELRENWATVTSTLAAKIQPEQDTVEVKQGQTQTDRTYRITLATELTIIPRASYRIVDASGYTYKMKSYHASSRIDQLPYLLAVRK
jgi:hypothetical protein